MPKKAELQSILVIGAGPIIIGQGCEFDYSGVQACKALKEDGCRVILVNSNPATIMTDPEMADAIYIEPLYWESIARIIEKEKPNALLPTMGGQTALNCALELVHRGILERFQVALIGAKAESIEKAEDRGKFRQAMEAIGLKTPRSDIAHSLESAKRIQASMGFPTIIRPSFTLGGMGGGIAYNMAEFECICERGLEHSPTNQLLIEQSIIGWKEYEMEVMRDQKDNCIIVCSIENLDPMGVHTGDSITVAPIQTLTDKEYQKMRDAAIAVLRKIGVETGGANVQFAVNPEDGELYVIEMNPRVSRSSALASKATGFPIAKIAAKLSLGYTLDELANEITGNKTPASFEPTIDYVVTKIPRFNFEKFPEVNEELTTQMKSVGEVMAIGRSFQESLQKAIRGLEVGYTGLVSLTNDKSTLHLHLQRPTWQRLWYVADAFRLGLQIEEIHALSKIDPWFLAEIQDIVEAEQMLCEQGISKLTKTLMYQLKRKGFSDERLALLCRVSEDEMRTHRQVLGVRPVYKRVDSCAAEFSTQSAYLYATYEQWCEANPSQTDKKIIVLGGGPNRIGQGIEFDYCCVHAVKAMHDEGYETIMVNCNPETVSTDYDMSDKLYFEALTLEDVLEIVHIENPKGVVIQFGGQTPLKLAKALEKAGVPILGTSPDAIDRAENRERFQKMIQKIGIKQPPSGVALKKEDVQTIAKKIGFPLIARPSYVLGGRAMEIIYHQSELINYLQRFENGDNVIALDRFLEDAIEVDIDAICDGQNVLIGGIMEHIEQAGVHSGDSACSLPPFSLSIQIQNTLRHYIQKIAIELNVVGLINAQFAIQNDDIYILEVNPRAARTVPFISKVIGLSLAKIAARCMVGQTLAQQQCLKEHIPEFYAVKRSIFPFEKFPGVDPILGPEMRSTGEVMGVGENFAKAYAKSELATLSPQISKDKWVFISVCDRDKKETVNLARRLQQEGFKLLATKGTAQAFKREGLFCECINKVNEGSPHIVEYIKNGKIGFIINTTDGRQAIAESNAVRLLAVQYKICYITTLSGAKAAVHALPYQKHFSVAPIRDLHLKVKLQ